MSRYPIFFFKKAVFSYFPIQIRGFLAQSGSDSILDILPFIQGYFAIYPRMLCHLSKDTKKVSRRHHFDAGGSLTDHTYYTQQNFLFSLGYHAIGSVFLVLEINVGNRFEVFQHIVHIYLGGRQGEAAF